MAQPTPYTRSYSFRGFQTSNPDDPLPGQQVDNELNAIKSTLDQILDNLELIQRDDGRLANNSVGVSQMDGALISLAFERPTPWATATAYEVDSAVFQSNKLYVCLVTHTSGTFNTDLAAAKWVEVVDFTTIVTDAEAARDDAEGFASSASAAKVLAEAAQAAAEAVFDSFDDVYLGAKTANPTLDNDGNALATGALYFNSTADEMRVYTGSAWVQAYAPGAGVLAASNNLSDVANAATARTNLGVIDATTSARGLVELSTTAEYWNNTSDRVPTGATLRAAGAPVTLTDGATITPDFSTGINFVVTLGGNRTLANPTNPISGTSGQIMVIQDATGNRTLAYGTNWKFPGGTDPTASTGGNAVDIISYYVHSSTFIAANMTKAYA